MKKEIRHSVLLAVGLTIALAVFPVSGSEAQSAEMPLSELSCGKLNNLRWQQMSNKQQAYAQQCDALDAATGWEQHYGNLDEQSMAAAAVYEPY